MLVNPYDIDGMADTLVEALNLSPSEAQPRMRALREAVRKLDVHRWADGYLRELEQRA